MACQRTTAALLPIHLSKDGSQGESIVMRSFHWRPPDDPIPQGSQLMTRQEALEKWNALKSMGWRRCAGPLR